MLTDYTSKKVVRSNKTELKGYEIILRNNKNHPVSLKVLDQLPISENKELEVKLEEQGGATFSEDYGRLLWKVDLAPGIRRKFVLSILLIPIR